MYQSLIQRALKVASPQAQEKYLFDEVDPEFAVYTQEVKAYGEAMATLHKQVVNSITTLKEFSQAMVICSESFAVDLKLDGGGVSMDACNYLNAMTAISNQSMADYETSIRQQVLSEAEYVLNEAKKIEDKVKHRMDMLKAHDALYKETIRSSNREQHKDQHERLANLQGNIFSLQNRLKLDMNLLLRDRTKVLQALLAHLSAIQLHLFAKMYVTLRKSDAMTRIFPTLAAAKTPSDGLQTVIDAGWDGTINLCGATGQQESVDDVELDSDNQAVIQETLEEVTDIVSEEALLVAIAVGHSLRVCEQEASKQYEQEQYSKSQPRRYPALSVWSNSNSPSTSPPVTDTAISNKSLSSSAPTNPTPLLSVVTSSSEESTHDSKAGSNTGTNDIKTSATPSSFNMDHIVKKFMPSAQASSGGGGGYFSISSGSKKATATEASVSSKTSLSSSTDRPKAGSTDEGGADESDGWNRIEQEFQRSLMKAASNAERKRDFKKPGASDGDHDPSTSTSSTKSYLMGFSKSFNLSFNLKQNSSNQGNTINLKPPASYLQYSLGNEAFKYNEAIHKEDMALLRVFMFPPGATTAKTTTTNRDRRYVHQVMLASALRYLNCVDLAQCAMTCSTWAEMLSGGEHAKIIWKQCVRRSGMPEAYRAAFWHHLMYSKVPWMESNEQSNNAQSPSNRSKHEGVVYAQLVARAVEQIQYFDKTGKMLSPRNSSRSMTGSGNEAAGTSPPPDSQSQGEIEAGRERGCSGSVSPQPPAPPLELSGQRRSNWISEIDVDVKRTYVIDKGYDLRKNLRRDRGSSAFSMRESFQLDGDSNLLSDFEGEDTDDLSQSFATEFYDRSSSLSYHPSISEEASLDESSIYSDGDDDVRTVQPDTNQPILQDEMSLEDRLSREIQRQRLKRVLWAFAMYDSKIHYCQGMNMVAAVLLKVTSNDEEAAFWLLVGLCERYHLNEMWSDGMPRLKLCFYVLERLIEARTPALYQHFNDVGVHVAMFSSKWFVTLFANLDTLPLKTVLRIWDLFLVEKWPVFFGVAISILEMLDQKLRPLELEQSLRLLHDPRVALREAFDEISQGDGKTHRRDSECRKISTILMRRTSAAIMGDKVLKDVETDYRLTPGLNKSS